MRNPGRLAATLAVAMTIGGAPAATAQNYPSRPITMVVPYGAGGPTDTIGRIVAEGMRASLGQRVIENGRRLRHNRCRPGRACAR
jgi:tripartite-type tricarboxylate transporter receptor subunit TctC